MAVAAERLVGTWRLVAYERWSDGEVSYPMGEDALGYLTYDPHGRMSVQIMRAGRPALAGEDGHQGPPDALRAAVDGYLGYAGTYEVDAQTDATGTVVHRIELHLVPNAVGTRLERRFELSGERLDRLTLYTSPAAGDGRPAAGGLSWERVGRAAEGGGRVGGGAGRPGPSDGGAPPR
jgi:hypothetical protein